IGKFVVFCDEAVCTRGSISNPRIAAIWKKRETEGVRCMTGSLFVSGIECIRHSIAQPAKGCRESLWLPRMQKRMKYESLARGRFRPQMVVDDGANQFRVDKQHPGRECGFR